MCKRDSIPEGDSMKRSTQLLAAMLAGFGVLATEIAVQGGVVALPPPGPARVANADAVIVGNVVGLEPEDVTVDKTTYRIAVVRINQGLKGTKDAKMLRIGFIPLPKPGENGKGPKVVVTGARPVQLQAGQEGLFILRKHAKGDFHVLGGVVGYFINSDKNADFDKEVQTVKAITKVMENPQAALKAKDAEERLLAAAILIDQYRTYRGPNFKLEPIDAEESKKILQALADSDWKTAGDFVSLRPSPARLFRSLGVTAADGFAAAGPNFEAAAQKWVREHAQKYRIQRIVAGDAKK
jgi:hypothetical protein